MKLKHTNHVRKQYMCDLRDVLYFLLDGINEQCLVGYDMVVDASVKPDGTGRLWGYSSVGLR